MTRHAVRRSVVNQILAEGLRNANPEPARPRRVSDALWAFLLGVTFGSSVGAFTTVLLLVTGWVGLLQ